MKRPKDMSDEERWALPDYNFRQPSGRSMAHGMQEEDILYWCGPDGAFYTFGQNSDGSWYKVQA